MHTRFRTFTDQEFLRLCSDKRNHSPVIDELCTRLEAYLCTEDEEDSSTPEFSEHIVCEVCEALLTL